MVVALIAAAGKGKRLEKAVNKQFLTLAGKPIIYYTLMAFENCQKITSIFLLLAADDIDYCQQKIINKYKFSKIHKIIEGGKERQDSIYNGIKQLNEPDKVLIHDGARPLISPELIERIVDELEREQAAILAVPAKDTIKSIGEQGYIEQTFDRKMLCLVQTPQGFHYNLIKSAYDEAYKIGYYATDDAALVERIGGKVKFIMGNYENFKITTSEDLVLAETILKQRQL